MKWTVLLLPLFLGACGTALAPRGTTHLTFDGEVCGSPAKFSLADGKDRQGAVVSVVRKIGDDECRATIRTAESVGSAAQARADQLNAQLLQMLGGVLVKSGLLPAVP